MKDRFPAIVAIIILFILVALTWWAADYARQSIPVDPPPAVNKEPSAWASQFTMITSDEEGLPLNRLDGIAMRYYPYNDTYEIDQAKATGEQADRPRTQGTSKLAVVRKEDHRVHMIGDAHLHRFPSEEHEALDIQSDELYIYPDDDIIETDLPALVTQGHSHLEGTGMKYNNKTGELKVFGSTGAKISPKDRQSKKDKQ